MLKLPIFLEEFFLTFRVYFLIKLMKFSIYKLEKEIRYS